MNWDRVERLIGPGNLDALRRKRVAIIGLGSGGGFIALALAMSGVGSFLLMDDDTLEETNIVRHVADRRYLGWNKADAVADLIHQRNAAASVTIVKGRLEANLDALDGCDLVVSGLDGEGSKYVLNQACLERRLTVVYAGVYERGEGGDVCLIHPYDGPCYACWAGELREGIAERRPSDEVLDYGMIGPEGTLEAEPGLWLHVTRIASVQADMALNELLRDSEIYRAQPGNTVVLANVALEIVDGQTSFPYSSIWATIDRDPDCLVCGPHYQQQEQGDSFSLQRLMENTGIVVESEADAAANAEADGEAPAPAGA